MPIPILIWIVIAVSSALAGTSIVMQWDKILAAFKGKKVAVLGARGVGKTHLITFLSTGSIPAEYKQTLAPDKASSRRFQLNELDLKINDTLDVSGDRAAYAEWKELHDQSDVIFYLLRADRLIVGDAEVEARVRDDLQHIGRWLEDRSPRPFFFIVGTHCDLDGGYPISQECIGNYVDKFRKLPIVNELVARGGGAQVTKVVIGSMESVQATEALVYEIFRQVTP